LLFHIIEKKDDNVDLLVRIGCQPPKDDRLCDHFFDFIILKEMVEELKVNRRPNVDLAIETENRMMRRAKVVVSTLNYCGSARMNRFKSKTAFLIIDEGKFFLNIFMFNSSLFNVCFLASQSLEADLLLPLRFKCDRIMLVGDPKQLAPCVLSKAGKKFGLSQSLYARLYSIFQENRQGPVSMLNTQYRMHPEICEFASEHFYYGRLSSDRQILDRLVNFPLKPLYVYNVTETSHAVDSDCSSFNDKEVKLIRYFCEKLINYLVTKEPGDVNAARNIRQRIAIITPYKAQMRRLKQCLPSDIDLMTGDSAQGKEKDIVIVSCVRSGGSDIGFLTDKRRMNVMLTRPKNGLYIFGNMTQLAEVDENWRAFLEHAQKKKCISDVNSISFDLPYC